MPFSIDKQFSACYGHRVWSQKLNADFTEKGDVSCKCRHIHGHEGLIHVFLEADEIDERGMICDFKELGWFKEFVDNVIDHKFIIDYNDPIFNELVVSAFARASKLEFNNLSQQFFLENHTIAQTVPGVDNLVAGYNIDVSSLEKGTSQYEVLEGYFIVDFIPTSENLSRWVYNIVNAKMSLLGVKTKEVWWNETPKSRSIYKG